MKHPYEYINKNVYNECKQIPLSPQDMFKYNLKNKLDINFAVD